VCAHRKTRDLRSLVYDFAALQTELDRLGAARSSLRSLRSRGGVSLCLLSRAGMRATAPPLPVAAFASGRSVSGAPIGRGEALSHAWRGLLAWLAVIFLRLAVATLDSWKLVG
jgi:hypothetical protein